MRKIFVMVQIVQVNEISKGIYQLHFTWVSLEVEYLRSGRYETLFSERFNVVIIVTVIIVIGFYYYAEQNKTSGGSGNLSFVETEVVEKTALLQENLFERTRVESATKLLSY